MKQQNYSKGYSLIELVIYIALFVVISIVIVQSLVFVMKTYANARSFRALQQNGELVMERITREVRQSNTVSTASSVFGVTPGTLVVSGLTSGGSAYTDTFSVVNGAVQLSTTGVISTLSTNEVVVNALTFWNITTANSDAIKVRLDLTTVKAPIVSKSFYSTIILRE